MPTTKTNLRETSKKAGQHPAAKKSENRTMSAAHKKALAEGRSMSATVDAYLAAINVPKKRGRKVSKAVLEQRLVQARERAKTATGVDKVVTAQEVRDLQGRLAQARAATGTDVRSLESAFVKVAGRFSERRGIRWSAWRDAGVAGDVLKKAGIARTRG
jgi:hypothetical protein